MGAWAGADSSHEKYRSARLVGTLLGVDLRDPQDALILRQLELLVNVLRAVPNGRWVGVAVKQLVDPAGAFHGAGIRLQRLDVVRQRLLVPSFPVIDDAAVGIGGGKRRLPGTVVGFEVGLEKLDQIGQLAEGEVLLLAIDEH